MNNSYDNQKVTNTDEVLSIHSEDNSPGQFKNNVKVIVRIRPLLQGESVLNKRLITATSGVMLANQVKSNNEIQLKFDARNKDSKVFQFDYVAEGDVANRDFF